jgi:hypothetical protein
MVCSDASIRAFHYQSILSFLQEAMPKSALFNPFGSIPFLRVARATRKNGESALILRVQSARKMSALNEKCTNEMLPFVRAVQSTALTNKLVLSQLCSAGV